MSRSKMASYSLIREKLVELLTCLSKVDSLVNSHTSNFFTQDLWNTILPPEVLAELNALPNLADFSARYLDHINGGSTSLEGLPMLSKFLHLSVSQTISSPFLTSSLELFSKFSAPIAVAGPEIKEFMSEKKKHEVTKFVPVVVGLIKETGARHVVDVGGGKGYLSTILANTCGLRLLSLDSSRERTCGAEKLEKKMLKCQFIAAGNEGCCLRETVFVSPGIAIKPLLVKHFGENYDVGLVGLHTCGDLASTCFRLFVEQNVRWIINIGCCYHLINEEYFLNPFWRGLEPGGDYGFPMSTFLQNKKASLGRNARMLSGHALHKLARDGINEDSVKSQMYRAVLQVLIEQVRGHSLPEGSIGKLYSKTDGFHQYIRKACQKLKLDISLSDEEINDLWQKFAVREANLQTFQLLRIHFAPIIELVILLDRLLYLCENGIENAYLVPLFNPSLSPRHLAIVAWR